MKNTDPVSKTPLALRYREVLKRIQLAEAACGRPAGSAELLAVSKTRPAEEIRALASLGQRRFGENYLQEAEEKIAQLRDLPLEWHFIGRIQSNKTRTIAGLFDWVHSVASLKHAKRLSEQRPDHLPPLNICLQVNTSGEASKAGHPPQTLADLMAEYAALPRLRIRGLMTLPAPALGSDRQREPFARLRRLRDGLRSDALSLETLSMGMSDDLEAAIMEGATLVRIGTAIFGPRTYNH